MHAVALRYAATSVEMPLYFGKATRGDANTLPAMPSMLLAYSDLAGCLKSARIRSGDIICLGYHMLEAWYRQQKVVALSSAEAELLQLWQHPTMQSKYDHCVVAGAWELERDRR